MPFRALNRGALMRALFVAGLALLTLPQVGFSQPETIVSCCSGTANPMGQYGSTDLPRTTFTVSGNASGVRLQAPGVTIFLGIRCDAYSPQYGNGSWRWANGGTRVTFADGRVVGFPRQVPGNLIELANRGCEF